MPKDLGLVFAYATNGHRILEYDFSTHTTRELTTFPTPQELWEHWKANTGLDQPTRGRLREAPAVYGIAEEASLNPLLCPYCPESL